MSVTITDNTPKILNQMQARASLAVRLALDDAKRISRPKTPMQAGFLRNSVLIKVLGTRGTIKWLARYAAFQERGMRRDGSHRVRRYTTGGTGKHFAENAIKIVARRPGEYFRKAKI